MHITNPVAWTMGVDNSQKFLDQKERQSNI